VTPDSTVTLAVAVTAASGNPVTVDVEFRPMSDPLREDAVSPAVETRGLVSGQEARIVKTNLTPGRYHWRYRATTGENSTGWVEYGLAGNTDFVVAAGPPPTILAVTPSAYAASSGSTSMIINGANFQNGATLTFFPAHGTPINSSSNKLTVSSSALITYLFDNTGDAGSWSVRVNNPDGQQSSSWPFQVTATVVPAPSITSLSPPSYPAQNGNQTLVINGANFQNAATLTFFPAHGTPISSSSNKLTVNSSAQITYLFDNAGDAGSWSVRVDNPDGQQSSSWPFQVTATVVPAPSVSGLSPATYPASNSSQSMLIVGSNFVNGATVTFHDPQGNGFPRTPSFVSSNQLNYSFNNGNDPGTWTVSVTNPDGKTSNTLAFSVTSIAPAPSISGLSPSTYPASNSSQSMLINGNNFVNGASVTFHDPQGNAFPRTPTFASASQLSYAFNNGNDPGTWTVSVTNPDGQLSNTWSFTVTPVIPAPSISSLSPSTYPASNSNQSMLINGNNFVNGATITFHDPQGNAFPRAPSFVSASQLSYSFNNGNDPGMWTVFITNPDGKTSNTLSFTVTSVLLAPSISVVSPSTYPASNSSQSMLINGSNFVNGASITFHDPQGNAFPRTPSFVSASQLSYSFNNGNDPGTWTIFATNPDGQLSNTVSFTVTSVPSPSISGLSPSSYPASSSSQSMLINGSNFVNGATITFHDPQGNAFTRTPSFVSANQLSYSFNNGNDPGTWTVFVTNPDGKTSNTLSFTVTSVLPAPSISGVSPSTYPASNSSQSMLINGSNFVNGATITFHDPQGNAFPRTPSFVSASQLSYSFNNGNDPGTWTVFATNPDGQLSNTVTFTVTSAPSPSISGLSPSSYVASSSSQSMLINGNNFVNGATITFHDPQGNAFPRTPSFVSANQLSYSFNNGNDPGTWTVFVTNPDGKTSNTLSFTVTSVLPPPSISGISPSTYPASNSSQSMLINGSNFVNGATITFHDPQGNAFPRTPSFVSAGQLSYSFNNGNDPGTWTVFVTNPDGQLSNTVSFTVTSAPSPAISGLSPSSYPASSSTQSMVINGSNFVNGATITFHDPQGNAFPRTPSFNSTSQLSYSFNNGNDPGSWTVFVTNPDGKTSNTWNFTVTSVVPAPAISGLSPSTYPASNSSQSMLINGNNFVSGASVTFHDPQGNPYLRSPGFNSSSQLSYSFNNGSDRGTWTVFVTNPDGKTSNTWSYTVN
jgi:nitrogen fixation protein FixH